MGFFKKAIFAATLPVTGGVGVRASTKKERHMKETERLLSQQNALLAADLDSRQRVPCPRCSELIVSSAKVCRFCGVEFQ